jgi:hypothetical protein
MDAGLTVPILRTRAPRLLPQNSGIDISTVNHVYSGAVSGSPFLATESKFDFSRVLLEASTNEISLLTRSCQTFYEYDFAQSGPPKTESKQQESNNSEESSTSSFTTDTESSGEEATGRGFLTIGDALSITKKARYVQTGDNSPGGLYESNISPVVSCLL